MEDKRAAQHIQDRVETVSRLARRMFLIRSILYGFGLGPLSFLLLLWLANSLSVGAAAFFSLSLAAALTLLLWLVQMKVMKDPAWVPNLWLNTDEPELAELLRSAIELSRDLNSEVVTKQTADLIDKQLVVVWQRLSRISPQSCLPPILTANLKRFVSVVICCLIGLFFYSDRLLENEGRLKQGITVPSSWVKGLSVTVAPPNYAGQKIKRYDNTNGSIRLLVGSLIEGSAQVDDQTSAWVLVLPDKTEVGLDATNGEVSFNFVARQSGPWRFAKKHPQSGELLVEKTKRILTVLPDKAPKVDLLKPNKDQTVSESQLIQVVYEARDDFGLTKSRLVVALDGDLEQAERAELDTLDRRNVKNAAELDLSLFDVQPGDRVAVYIECLDNSEPKSQIGRSKALYLTIESAEKDHRDLSLDLKKLLEPFLVDLADRLEIEDADPTANAITALHEQTETNAASASKLLTRLLKDPLTPQEVSALLQSKLDDVLDEIDSEKIIVQRVENPERLVSKALSAMPPLVASIEEFIIAIESAVARLALEDMQALTRQIQQRKERIKDLLNAYREKPSQSLKNRIMRNVKRLKQKMEELRQRMAQLRQKLPEEFLNLDGLKGSKLSESMKESAKSLDDLESMLEEGRIDEAMRALDELSESLDAFDELVSEDMETLHREGDPKRQQAISEMMDRTRDLLKAQEQLMAETQAAKDRGEKAFEEAMGNRSEAILNQIASDLVESERAIEAQKKGTSSTFRTERLERLGKEVAEALETLENKKYRRAERHIGQSAEISRQLTWDRASKDHEKDREINRKIQRAETALKELLQNAKRSQEAAQDLEQIEKQAEQQAKLKESIDKLNETMRGQGQQVPGLEGKPSQSLEEAGAAMGKAQQSLRNYSPGRAQPSQSEAMNALKQTIQNLREAAKPNPAKREGQGRMRSEKVEIPDGEDYAAPSAFREELLKAMKGKTAKPNEDAVKRYYRSLVE